MNIPIFGTPSIGKTYAIQDCAYAVITDDAGRVAVAETPKGLVLIGGGIERGESAQIALMREAYEESGHKITIIRTIGNASQYVNNAAKSRFRLKRGTFFLCHLGERIGPPLEPDHTLVWMDAGLARERLIRSFHRWALEEVAFPGINNPDFNGDDNAPNR